MFIHCPDCGEMFEGGQYYDCPTCRERAHARMHAPLVTPVPVPELEPEEIHHE